MGNVMDFQSGAWLFWGNQRVEIAAIQILPVTPANEVSRKYAFSSLAVLTFSQPLYDPHWVQNVWDYTMPELQDPSIGDEW